MRRFVPHLRAIGGVAFSLSRYHRTQLLIAVLGVAMAVILVLMLAGLFHGVQTQGAGAIDNTNRDLWLGTPAKVTPGTVGAIENQLLDAHGIVRDVRSQPGVREAEAIGFQTVYVSPDGREFSTVVGVGITGTTAPIKLQAGSGFEQRDVHFADGSYDGPMTRRVVIDQGLASAYNLTVGDPLYVGGTLADARDQRFEIVGISPTFSAFLGSRSVIFHLAELQTLTRKTGTDPAALIAITVEADQDPESVAASLEVAYPEYTVRTNREQLNAILGRQAAVLASVLAILLVGASIGAALVVTVLAQIVLSQRTHLATLQAAGVSGRTLASIIGLQGLGVGGLGGLVGWLLSHPLAAVLNSAVGRLVGPEALIIIPTWAQLAAVAFAIAFGTLGAFIAGWQLWRSDPVTVLRSPT